MSTSTELEESKYINTEESGNSQGIIMKMLQKLIKRKKCESPLVQDLNMFDELKEYAMDKKELDNRFISEELRTQDPPLGDDREYWYGLYRSKKYSKVLLGARVLLNFPKVREGRHNLVVSKLYTGLYRCGQRDASLAVIDFDKGQGIGPHLVPEDFNFQDDGNVEFKNEGTLYIKVDTMTDKEITCHYYNSEPEDWGYLVFRPGKLSLKPTTLQKMVKKVAGN